MRILYSEIDRIDSMGYEDGTKFAVSTERLKRISGSDSGIYEIRVDKRLWRIITLWDVDRQALVMLDAFEAHKNKQLLDKVGECKDRIAAARELIKGGMQWL